MSNNNCINDSTREAMDGLDAKLREIVAACYPKTLSEEDSFQKRFLANAKAAGYKITDEVGTPVLKNLKSQCISPLPKERWGVDFIIRFGNVYIPIELKLRHKKQDVGKYPQDFIDDIDEIRRLLIEYDDMPEGIAICLTSLDEMEEKCNEKANEYTEKNNLHDNHAVKISWYPIDNTNYRIGIVDRVHTGSRKPTGKMFVFLNEDKKKELK